MEQTPSLSPEQKSRKTLWIVVGVALLVACCGGGYYFANSDDDPKANAEPIVTSSPAASATQAPSAAPTASPTKPVTLTTITLTMPAKLGGRPKSKDPKLVAAAQSSAKAQEATKYVNGAGQEVKFTDGLSAFYGSGTNLVLVVAAKASAPMSGADLDKEFARLIAVDGVSKAGDAVVVDAGKMGGSARCADVVFASGSTKVPAAICVWVDHGSMGSVAWFNKNVTQAKRELVAVRGQIEHQK